MMLALYIPSLWLAPDRLGREISSKPDGHLIMVPDQIGSKQIGKLACIAQWPSLRNHLILHK